MRKKLLTLLGAIGFITVYAQQAIPGLPSPLFNVTSRGNSSTSQIRATAKDASNNVYVVGYIGGDINTNADASAPSFMNSNGGTDIYVAKYNSSGVLKWRFTVGGSSADQANAIAVDGNNNIYITGNINGTTAINLDPSGGSSNTVVGAGGQDIFVAKYNDVNGTSAPTFKWAYAIGGAGTDQSNAIALDVANNAVFIAGGVTYNAASGSLAAGNIAMSGNTASTTNILPAAMGSTMGQDVFVAKLTDAGSTASVQWAFNVGQTGSDIANALAYDGTNLFVAGAINGTTAIDMDPSSNTYNITGAGGNDMFIAKYDGTQTSATSTNLFKWAFRAGSSTADVINGMSIDASGSLYIVGSITGVASGATNIDMDPSANTSTGITQPTGAANTDIIVAKYDGTQTSATSTSLYTWAFQIGTANAETGTAIAVDASKNVYITGTIGSATTSTSINMDPSSNTNNITGATSTSSTDIFVAKYDGTQTSGTSTSIFKWAFSVGSSSSDAAQTILVDGNSKIWLGGGLYGDPTVNVFTGSSTTVSPTIAATSAALLTYDGTTTPGTGFYVSSDLLGNTSTGTVINGSAIDAAGNVYVCGNFTGGRITLGSGGNYKNLTNFGSLSDGFVAKYNKTGVLQWAFNFGGANADQALGLALDATGANLFVTGTINNGVNVYMDPANSSTITIPAGSNGLDLFLAKYSTTDGSYQGAFNIGSTGNDYGLGVATDKNNNVFVTGYITAPSATATPISAGNSWNVTTTGGVASTDIFVAKYTGSGTLSSSNCQWAYLMGGTGSDEGNAITVDNNGNVYLSGQVQYNATAPTNASIGSVVFNNGSTSIITNGAGSTMGSTAGKEIFLAKLVDAGTSASVQWAFNAGGSSTDYSSGIAVDANQNIYITGITTAVSGSNITYKMDPYTSNTISSPVLNPTSNSADVFLAKYDGSQTSVNSNLYKWAFITGGYGGDLIGNSSTFNGGLALDASNGIYLTGVFADSATANQTGHIYGLNPANSSFVYTLPVKSGASATVVFTTKFNGNYLPTSPSFYQWTYNNSATNNNSDKSNTISTGAYGSVIGGQFLGSQVDFDPTAGTQNLSSTANGTSTSMFISALPPQYAHWTGTTNTNWGTSTNWAYGAVPVTSVSAAIPAVTNLPVIANSTTQTAYDLVINNSASVTNNGTLNVGSAITNSGTFNSTAGTVGFNGAAAQTIPALSFATNTIKGLTVNNIAGVTLGGTLNVTGLITPTAGTLTTGGYLTLASSSSGTAAIGAGSGSYISGNVTAQQYIPSGFRTYRFLSHPFSTAKALNLITNDIDITGAGGSTNGFTTTASNNPSAYAFTTANSDGNATNDAGWTAFTSATASSWGIGQGIRVLVRGAKGQANSLDGTPAGNGTGGTYLPAAVTLNMSGAVNMGNQTITLASTGSGSTAGFNLVGNPYPSPLDIGTVINAASNITKTVYVRNPQTSAYVTTPITGAYVIPANTSYFIQATSGSPTLNFTESNKSTCTSCATVFGNGGPDNYLQLKVTDTSGAQWDNLFVILNNSSNSKYEKGTDAVKLTNDKFNLYSISSDKQMLAVDYRAADTLIPLGIAQAANISKPYIVTVSDFKMKDGYDLYLRDKLTNTLTELSAGTSYNLNVNSADSNSVGENRLSIVMKPKTVAVADNADKFSVTIGNNPAIDNVLVYYAAPQAGHTTIRLISNNGQQLAKTDLGVQQSGQTIIPVSQYAQGVYLIEVTIGNDKVVKKIEKK